MLGHCRDSLSTCQEPHFSEREAGHGCRGRLGRSLGPWRGLPIVRSPCTALPGHVPGTCASVWGRGLVWPAPVRCGLRARALPGTRLSVCGRRRES